MVKHPQSPPPSAFDELVKLRRQPTGQPDIRPSSQPTVQTAIQPAVQTGRAKSSDDGYVKFTTYIRRETHRAIKLKMVEQGREMSDLVEEVLEKWLSGVV